jgi:hypothetical protein
MIVYCGRADLESNDVFAAGVTIYAFYTAFFPWSVTMQGLKDMNSPTHFLMKHRGKYLKAKRQLRSSPHTPGELDDLFGTLANNFGLELFTSVTKKILEDEPKLSGIIGRMLFPAHLVRWNMASAFVALSEI